MHSPGAFAKLKIATTTEDLAALVKDIGQDQVEVFAIAKGTQDAHQIEAKPSFMVKIRDADLIVSQGLELESAWLEPLIQGSRNVKLKTKQGVLELGPELDPIEIPKGNLSRADGDVHPGGNPHFQLDPIRMGKAAVLIGRRLAQLDSVHQSQFTTSAQRVDEKFKTNTSAWQARVQKTGVTELVTYHKTFSYFCDRFHIKCALHLEPKPGIPPTASHLLDVLTQIKQRKITQVWIENYFDAAAGDKLKTEISTLNVHRAPVGVGGAPHLVNTEAVIDELIRLLEMKP